MTRSLRRLSRLLGLALCLALLQGCQPMMSPLPSVIPALLHPATANMLPGKFFWFELVTRDVEAAKRFYGPVFGWTFHDIGPAQNRYTVISRQGTPIGGIVIDPAMRDANAAAQWVGFMSERHPEELAEFVLAHGGEILIPPAQMPDLGQYVVFKDPEGAVLGALRSSSGDPPDELPPHGSWMWMELWSSHPKDAAEFYHKLAGYRVFQDTGSEQPDNFLLVSAGVARAGVVPLSNSAQNPFWLGYLRVQDVTRAVAIAEQAGATILVQPDVDVFEERLAILVDPMGAVFGLIEVPDATEEPK